MKGFLKKFGIKEEIPSSMLSGKYFIMDPVKEVVDSIKDKPSFAGIYLGESGTTFTPSVYLLNYIKDLTKKKMIIDEKSAWLFVCGRDIFEQSVISGQYMKGDFVLVLNEQKECLGYGKVVKDKIFVKSYFDIGNFLRRERKRKNKN